MWCSGNWIIEKADNSMIEIRVLDPVSDRIIVTDLFERCADYVLLETGEPPGADNVTEYFTDAPKGTSQDNAMKLGVFGGDGRLIGVMDIVRGYPEVRDWYIGLLMLDPASRGEGLGRQVVQRILDAARGENIARIMLCVLKENLRGRAFWHREGFSLRKKSQQSGVGRKTDSRYELVRHLV